MLVPVFFNTAPTCHGLHPDTHTPIVHTCVRELLTEIAGPRAFAASALRSLLERSTLVRELLSRMPGAIALAPSGPKSLLLKSTYGGMVTL